MLGAVLFCVGCGDRLVLRVPADHAASGARDWPLADVAEELAAAYERHTERHGNTVRVAVRRGEGEADMYFVPSRFVDVGDVVGPRDGVERAPFARDVAVVRLAAGHAAVHRPSREVLLLLRFALPPESTPTGALGRAFLERFHRDAETVDVADETTARNSLGTGDAEAMVTFGTDAQLAGAPALMNAPDIYERLLAVAMTEDSRRFLRFLETDEAKQILADAGYEMP